MGRIALQLPDFALVEGLLKGKVQVIGVLLLLLDAHSFKEGRRDLAPALLSLPYMLAFSLLQEITCMLRLERQKLIIIPSLQLLCAELAPAVSLKKHSVWHQRAQLCWNKLDIVYSTLLVLVHLLL